MKKIYFLTLFLFTINITHATQILKCQKYGLDTTFTLDKESLPEGVSVSKKLNIVRYGLQVSKSGNDDYLYFLKNESSTPLYIQLNKDTMYKFQNGKAYMKYINNKFGTDDYFEISQKNWHDPGSITQTANFIGDLKVPYDLYSDNPYNELKPQKFSFPAEYNGEKIFIKGQASFEQRENHCLDSDDFTLWDKLYVLCVFPIKYVYYLIILLIQDYIYIN